MSTRVENAKYSPAEARGYADHLDSNVKKFAVDKAQEMLDRAGRQTKVQLLPASRVFGTHGNTLCISRRGTPIYNLENCKKIAAQFLKATWNQSYGNGRQQETRAPIAQANTIWPIQQPTTSRASNRSFAAQWNHPCSLDPTAVWRPVHPTTTCPNSLRISHWISNRPDTPPGKHTSIPRKPLPTNEMLEETKCPFF